MSVYILTKKEQLKACMELAACMEKTCGDVTVFTNDAEFYGCLDVASPGEVEYVMIDVRTFQMDLFNPYTYIARCKNPVPVVVFNDPFPAPDERAAFWYAKNKDYFLSLLGIKRIEGLVPAFALLQEYFNNHDLQEFFSCMCPPKEFFTKAEKDCMDALEHFAENHKIIKSRKDLFDLFLHNQGKIVSTKELCMGLWNDYSMETRQRLCTYISYLRREFRKETALNIDIVRKGKELYQMTVVPAKNE